MTYIDPILGLYIFAKHPILPIATIIVIFESSVAIIHIRYLSHCSSILNETDSFSATEAGQKRRDNRGRPNRDGGASQIHIILKVPVWQQWSLSPWFLNRKNKKDNDFGVLFSFISFDFRCTATHSLLNTTALDFYFFYPQLISSSLLLPLPLFSTQRRLPFHHVVL